VPVTFIPRNNSSLEAKGPKNRTWRFRVKLEAAKTAIVKAMFIHVYLRGEREPVAVQKLIQYLRPQTRARVMSK
jgi:hypothetical protein